MSSLNRVFLIGNIGNELELKSSAQGSPYLRLSLATDENRKGEKVTYWHRVVVFGQQAELCKTYLTKGSRVMIEGSLEVRTFTDQETGKKRTFVSVVARSVQFFGGRKTVEVFPDQAETESETIGEADALAESA